MKNNNFKIKRTGVYIGNSTKLKQGLHPIQYAYVLTETEQDAIDLVRLIKAAKEIGITPEENEFTEVHELCNNNTRKLQK